MKQHFKSHLNLNFYLGFMYIIYAYSSKRVNAAGHMHASHTGIACEPSEKKKILRDLTKFICPTPPH